MVASDDFEAFLRESLAPLGPLTFRRMFGKTGVFCDGLMFGMVTEDLLYLRVDDGNRIAFAEASLTPPLNYAKQGEVIDLSFWQVPNRVLLDSEEFVVWSRRALDAAGRVAAKRKPRKPRYRIDY